MRMPSSLLVSLGTAMGLTAIAIAVILLASNFTIINAQPQQVTSQPGEVENGTTTAATTVRSTNDSFSVQVPQGWVIQDVNNAGSALSEETTTGYGLLAQLCPEEQQGGAAALSTNAGGGGTTNSSSGSSISTSNSCQGPQEVIHIIRYPNFETTIQPDNNITAHHLQKLQEVNYTNIQIVNSTETTVNLTNPQTNETITTVPAKFVEMTYGTASAPDETRRGYFISTATNETAPNLGITKGYSVFYEGNSTTSTAAEITTASGSLPPPTPVAQIFGSFELIAAPEVVEAAEDDDDGDDNGGDDDDGDDNGGDDDDGDDNGGDDDDGDDNGGDDDDGDDNGGDDDGGDDDGEGEGNATPNDPNEFEDCVIVGGGAAGDVGC
jgi:hypothetical protein